MKKYLISVLISATLGSVATDAMALEIGSNSPYDYRIKTVIYNPENVVKIDAIPGVETHIVLSPDETYITHAFGDSQSWTFAHVYNHIFVKPKNAMSDTNLVIVTDKHTYNIVLHYIDAGMKKNADGTETPNFIATPWAVKQATLQLTYEYPFEHQNAIETAAKNKAIENKLKESQFAGPINTQYIMTVKKGMTDIEPIHVYDNYRFTRFEFPQNSDLPKVFYMSSGGQETTPNCTTEGEFHNIIQCQNVAQIWKVRLGQKEVVGVKNLNYLPNVGAISTGTASPDVRRVQIRGN